MVNDRKTFIYLLPAIKICANNSSSLQKLSNKSKLDLSKYEVEFWLQVEYPQQQLIVKVVDNSDLFHKE